MVLPAVTRAGRAMSEPLGTQTGTMVAVVEFVVLPQAFRTAGTARQAVSAAHPSPTPAAAVRLLILTVLLVPVVPAVAVRAQPPVTGVLVRPTGAAAAAAGVTVVLPATT